MKLLLLSSLLALAYGQAEVADEGRELWGNQATEKFWVKKFGCSVLGSDKNSNIFKIYAKHNKGQGNGGQRYFAVNPTCMQGATKNIQKFNINTYKTPSWMKVQSLSKGCSGGACWANWNIKILPQIMSTKYFDKKSGKGKFCMFFGIGDGVQPYGFRELELSIKFIFAGGFSGASFYTRAYDPKKGSTTKKYTASLKMCSNSGEQDPNTKDKMKVHFPGKVICATVCPGGKNDPVYINGITWMAIQEQKNWKTTTAPGGWTNLKGMKKPGNRKAKFVDIWCPKVMCKYKYKKVAANKQDAAAVPAATEAEEDITAQGEGETDAEHRKRCTRPSNGDCCQVKFLLPAKYYPQLRTEKPTSSKFSIHGKGTFSCAGCGKKTLGRRLDEEGRELQEEDLAPELLEEEEEDEGFGAEPLTAEEADNLGGTVEMNEELEILMNGGEEDSSAGSVAAGAAAAAAMGAALLI